MKKEFLTLLCTACLLGACSTNPPEKPVAELSSPPEPITPPVAPVPPPARAPQPVPQNVPFVVWMDAFFDFDNATLRVEGRAALDDLAARFAVTRYDTLTIVGHADRIGSVEYNQKLSERRAAAMRDYLILQGVDAQRIAASGVGKSQPTAACPKVGGARLINCLQPDRNAVLTATGSQVVLSVTLEESD